MKILIISPYLPWPLYSGSSVRIFNFLKELSRQGHKITLLAGHGEITQLPADHILNRICKEVHLYRLPLGNRLSFILRSLFSFQPYPASRFLTDSLRENLRLLLQNQKFDLIWINFTILVDALSFDQIRNTPIVLDLHECEELVYRYYLKKGKWMERLFASINLVKLKQLQRRVLSKVNIITCVSKKEAAFIQGKVPRQIKIWIVPNGVDTEFFQPEVPLQNKENRILFCGNLCIRRNIDAAIWFTKKIFPKIREQIPDAEFWIVGSYPTSEIWQLNLISGVHVTGTVNEIRDYYLKGNVFVAPYHFSAGVKLKVLETMASGTPVVSTTAGCQGIEVIDGQHVLIANNETEFSHCVMELLRNSERAQKLATAARALVEEKYQWQKIVDELKSKLQELISSKR